MQDICLVSDPERETLISELNAVLAGARQLSWDQRYVQINGYNTSYKDTDRRGRQVSALAHPVDGREVVPAVQAVRSGIVPIILACDRHTDGRANSAFNRCCCVRSRVRTASMEGM